MKVALVAIAALVACGGLVACSGGGGLTGVDYGLVCPNNDNPFSMKPSKPAQKIQLDPISLLPGTYTYAGSELYYFNRKTKQQLYVVDQANTRTGKFSTTTKCAGGLSPNTNKFEAQIKGVTAITVGNDKKHTVTVQVRDFVIGFTGAGLIKDFHSISKARYHSVAKVYQSGGFSQYYLYNMGSQSTANYQIRSTYDDGNTVVKLLIKLTRNDPGQSSQPPAKHPPVKNSKRL